MFEKTSHPGWYIHDAYWVGACVFLVHCIWLRPSFLHHKHVMLRLVAMTAFWPLTYAFFIFHILRMRMIKTKSTK